MEEVLNDIEDTTYTENPPTAGADVVEWKPRIGMKFEIEEKAYDFYNSYAGRVGFSIRKEYFNKSKKTGKLSSRLLTCCKEGFRGDDILDSNTKTPRTETRTGCLTRMLIQVSKYTHKFEVTEFVKSRNHPLMIDKCMHMLPSQRRISRVQAIDLELASDSGISPRNSYELMERQASGKELVGYMKLDLLNHIRTRRHTKLKYEEAAWLMNYFKTLSCEDPSFFYAFQLDSDQMITNIFWADSKMIVDYCNFGDVVSFDTTYKVVHVNHPFGSFLGLNHHWETAVFGAAFMYEETAESFIWLFETFLKAMFDKAPKTIFTDQDAAMGKALTQKHLGLLFRRAQGFKKVLSKLMFEIEEEEEFTREWNLMITEYGVVGNTWLTNLLGLKHRWAMAFIKHAWSAGIHSTQLSESFNGCLKAYLSKQLILPDFFTHFERLLSNKRYKEYVAEYGLLHNLPQLKTNYNILVEAANLYTKVIFNSFQEEFLAASAIQRIIGCSPIEGNRGCVYKVVGEDGMQRNITRTSEDELLRSCCKFEREGIMCKHSLKILKDSIFTNTLPCRYILRRWTRSARDDSLEENLSGEVIVDADPKIEVRRWHRVLCRILTEISSILSEDKDGYNDLLVKAMKWKKITQSTCKRRFAERNPIYTAGKGKNQYHETNINTDKFPNGLKCKDTWKGKFKRLKPTMDLKSRNKTKSLKRINSNETLQSGEAGASTYSGTIPYHVLVNGCEIPVEFVNEENYVTPPQCVMHHIRFSQLPAELSILLTNQTFVADSCNSNTNYSHDDCFSEGFRIDMVWRLCRAMRRRIHRLERDFQDDSDSAIVEVLGEPSDS
ncbi:protein FAR1-RELATED SEQUENCE 5-like [Cornus florida]|uniref:protein FAR1-RELATED SEQUENCE 5-like n=1 Tax=Cornus florida TaxID=4283 RepID=UPI00289E647F|nr:protein FAR1-RELATED SEQUENCE 5-like [Cornus florida]